jgi:Holliday junction resolvase RusA-like endonuclease
MHSINIKPLSVNQAWGGRTFKSAKYKKYSNDVPLMLPPLLQLPPDKMVLLLKFYFSSKASDVDNPVKPIQDIITRHYAVDDKHIYMLMVEKNIVKRGHDRIEFEFLEYNASMFDKCRELIIKTD